MRGEGVREGSAGLEGGTRIIAVFFARRGADDVVTSGSQGIEVVVYLPPKFDSGVLGDGGVQDVLPVVVVQSANLISVELGLFVGVVFLFESVAFVF